MSILTIVIILVVMTTLQVFLSMKKNRWFGLIIPVINVAVVIAMGLQVFGINRGIRSIFMLMIPIVINLVIYVVCRNNCKQKNYSKIIKMEIDT